MIAVIEEWLLTVLLGPSALLVGSLIVNVILYRESRDQRKVIEAALPALAKTTSVLEAHNALDVSRGAMMGSVQKLIDEGLDRVPCEVSASLAKILTMLKALIKEQHELHAWHVEKDPNHPGAKIWWGTDLPDCLRILKEIRAVLLENNRNQGAAEV